jgi:hypothetical protein
MPELLSHSDYWCLQAQEARLAAQRIEDDPEARADLLAKADEYDRFAACNREWETQLLTTTPATGAMAPAPEQTNAPQIQTAGSRNVRQRGS